MILYGSSDKGALACLDFIKKKIKKFEFKKIKNLSEIKRIKYNNIELIITGSSLGNSLDKKLINFSKIKKIKSISIIEHWTNYKKRFLYRRKYLYPDYIFLNDKFAFKEALKYRLPKKKLLISGNPYLSNNNYNLKFKKIRNKLDKLKKNKVFLFLSENISHDKKNNLIENYKINEFDVIKKIQFFMKKNDYLIIKLHPEEDKEKFDAFKNRNTLVYKNLNMKEMIYVPKFIFGLKTILLYRLAKYKKKIISLINNNNSKFIDNFFTNQKKVNKKIKIFNQKKSILTFRKKLEFVLND